MHSTIKFIGSSDFNIHDACCVTAYKDYCADSKQQYRIPAGSSSSQDISITIMKDNILEASETFIATIELTDNPGLQSRLSTGISQTVVTIQDDDSSMLIVVILNDGDSMLIAFNYKGLCLKIMKIMELLVDVYSLRSFSSLIPLQELLELL